MQLRDQFPLMVAVAIGACSDTTNTAQPDASSSLDAACSTCHDAASDDVTDAATTDAFEASTDAPNEAPVDAPMDAPLDAGDGCGQAGYPPGPYGTQVGDVIANLQFSGWIGALAHVNDPLGPVCLGRYHADPNVKALSIEGGAVWCGPCNQEQASLVALYPTYSGAAAFLGLLLDGPQVGIAATQKNLIAWVKTYKQPYDEALDSTYQLESYFTSFDAGVAFPAHLVVRTDTMVIAWAGEGVDNATLQAQLDAIVYGPQDAGGN